MDKLVIVRHGHYDSNDQLSECGRVQIRELSKKLKSSINGSPLLILTSNQDRARQSAEILGSAFNVGFEEYEILWSEGKHPEDLPGALELIRSRKNDAEVIVLVTHYEYVEDFPRYFGKNELGVELRSHLIDKGQAWVIDCQQKTIKHIR